MCGLCENIRNGGWFLAGTLAGKDPQKKIFEKSRRELSDAPKIIEIGPVSAENEKIQNHKNHRLLF